MTPSVSVNFISLVISRVGLQEEEEPQTAHPMSTTWASHIVTMCGEFYANGSIYPVVSYSKNEQLCYNAISDVFRPVSVWDPHSNSYGKKPWPLGKQTFPNEVGLVGREHPMTASHDVYIKS